MNEPKRRGRPPKAKPEMVELPVVEQPDEALVKTAWHEAHVEATVHNAAQAYAMRVWSGQAPQVSRKDRIERVKRALAGQNLPFEGVELP